jgi:hypothetical protein
LVFFGAQRVIIQPVRGAKNLAALDVYHGLLGVN